MVASRLPLRLGQALIVLTAGSIAFGFDVDEALQRVFPHSLTVNDPGFRWTAVLHVQPPGAGSPDVSVTLRRRHAETEATIREAVDLPVYMQLQQMKRGRVRSEDDLRRRLRIREWHTSSRECSVLPTLVERLEAIRVPLIRLDREEVVIVDGATYEVWITSGRQATSFSFQPAGDEDDDTVALLDDLMLALGNCRPPRRTD